MAVTRVRNIRAWWTRSKTATPQHTLCKRQTGTRSSHFQSSWTPSIRRSTDPSHGLSIFMPKLDSHLSLCKILQRNATTPLPHLNNLIIRLCCKSWPWLTQLWIFSSVARHLNYVYIYTKIAYLHGSSANSMAHKCISILQRKYFHFCLASVYSSDASISLEQRGQTWDRWCKWFQPLDECV